MSEMSDRAAIATMALVTAVDAVLAVLLGPPIWRAAWHFLAGWDWRF